ncbi:MAG: VTT domain-containing protein [Clostridia bacterium]|nr:VTT domain-containing protein [Clostridia bacterium]
MLIILLVLSRNENIQQWYQTYQDYLLQAELAVENMGDKASVFLVIIFLYAFKALFPLYLYPLSLLCAITSTVFPAYFSIPINIMGLVILYSIRYYWGTRVGAVGIQNILQRNRTVRYLVENNDGRGNPWLLSLFRFIPGIPINLVSKLYGAMGFRFRDYILLSLLGFSPLLISYTFIGRNVFNPLSAPFLVPFILLFTLISISALATNKILQVQSHRRKKTNG